VPLQCGERQRSARKVPIEPLYCYAVSAKRYALFNKDSDNRPIIRKASAHGLGHLYPPYSDEDPDGPGRDSGVVYWQEELWRDIVAAALQGEPPPIPLALREQLNIPAASRYSATTPHILSWFRKFNELRPYTEQVRPFNFLVWFHAKRREEIFWQEGSEHGDSWDPRATALKPVAPYNSNFSKAADQARDRETWEPVSRAWLRTYAEALRQYAIHPETKFLGGAHIQSGPLKRRHVFATAPEYIGKEADRWEEDSHFGADEDSSIAYGFSPADRAGMTETIVRAIQVEKIGVKKLAKKSGPCGPRGSRCRQRRQRGFRRGARQALSGRGGFDCQQTSRRRAGCRLAGMGTATEGQLAGGGTRV
jgi:hypothetical protein